MAVVLASQNWVLHPEAISVVRPLVGALKIITVWFYSLQCDWRQTPTGNVSGVGPGFKILQDAGVKLDKVLRQSYLGYIVADVGDGLRL